jgi:glycosyltransferase involved in cell wall biosynthesis
MILVDGLFVNKGGGAVLLHYLIEQLLQHPRSAEVRFLLDPRFKLPQGLKDNYEVVPNKLSERAKFYKRNSDKFSRVFCFANTPPPRRLKSAQVFTYFHNQKLIEAPRLKFKREYSSQYIKYLFVRLYNRNTNYYIVQTPHMVKGLLDLGLKDAQHILTIPFYDADRYKKSSTPFQQRPIDQFAFVSTPSPQKNMPNLFDAWEHLHSLGHTPGLHVTVDETAPHLLARIEELKAKGVQISNYSYIDPRELYFKYRYLLCPSIMESFGLPLIEAVESDMKVLAPDLPYVYDVIKPSLTFNPFDKTSIAQAALTAMNTELPMPEIVTHNEVKKLIEVIMG